MKKEAIKQVVRSKKFAVATASVLSAAAGSVATYFATQKYFDDKYARRSDEEIREAKLYYARKNKEGEFSDPVELAKQYSDDGDESDFAFDEDDNFNPQTAMVKQAAQILEEQNYVPYNKPDETAQTPAKEVIDVKTSIKKNLFDSPEPPVDAYDDFDLVEELDKKADGLPYILEKEEFDENELERSVSRLIYFEEDGVLMDDNDSSVVPESTVGSVNLKFGHGSKDMNIVYIANEQLDAQYEVVRNNGSFTEQVMGFIKHSDDGPRGPRKMKDHWNR